MSPLRSALAALGLLAAALGLVTALVPETAAAVPVEGAIALLGNDYLLLSVFGVAGVAVVLAALTHRSIEGVDQAVPPDPEGVPTGERAGADFDRLVRASPWWRLWSGRDDRDDARERLREAAVGAVMRASNCSRADARDRVDRGTWTDDPVAAAFLADGENEDGGDPLGLHDRSLPRRARRTVAAIERLDGGDDRDHEMRRGRRGRESPRDGRGKGREGENGRVRDRSGREERSTRGGRTAPGARAGRDGRSDGDERGGGDGRRGRERRGVAGGSSP